MVNFFNFKRTPASYIRNIRSKVKLYNSLSIVLGLSIFFYYMPLEVLLINTGKYLITLSNELIIKGFVNLAKYFVQPLGFMLFASSGTVATVLISLAVIAYIIFRLKPAANERTSNFTFYKEKFFKSAYQVAKLDLDITRLQKKLAKVKSKATRNSSFIKDYLLDLLVNSRQSFYVIISIIVAIIDVCMLFYTPAFLLSTPAFLAVFVPIAVMFFLSWFVIYTSHWVLEKELISDSETLSKMCLIMKGYKAGQSKEEQPDYSKKNYHQTADTQQRVNEKLTRLLDLYKNNMTEPDSAERDIAEYKEKIGIQYHKPGKQK